MKKILIVDDDATFQKSLTTALKAKKYLPISAMDGEEGFAKAQSEKPDLILIDVVMPKLDGLGLLKKLQENKDETSMTPVLVTSNLSSIDKIDEALSLGIKGYILKSDENLSTIIKEIEAIVG